MGALLTTAKSPFAIPQFSTSYTAGYRCRRKSVANPTTLFEVTLIHAGGQPKVCAVTLVEPMPDGSPFALFVPQSPHPTPSSADRSCPSPRDGRPAPCRGSRRMRVQAASGLDAGGSAVFLNASMQALARRAEGLSLDRSGRPLLTNLAARRRFDALSDDVSKGGAGGVVSAQRTFGARDYAVLVAPSPASEHLRRLQAGPDGGPPNSWCPYRSRIFS